MLKNLLTIFCISILLISCGGEDDSNPTSNTTSSNQNQNGSSNASSESIKLVGEDLKSLLSHSLFDHQENLSGEPVVTRKFFDRDGVLNLPIENERGSWTIENEAVCMVLTSDESNKNCYEIYLNSFNKYEVRSLVNSSYTGSLSLVEYSPEWSIKGDGLKEIADRYNKKGSEKGLIFYIKENYVCGKKVENSVMTTCMKFFLSKDGTVPYEYSFYPTD